LVKFNATILQFQKQGEKTGWSYISIPPDIASKLKPGNRKGFRVKGKLDNFPIEQIALLPMGEGEFILPINASMRKGTGKRKGAMLKVQLEEDKKAFKLSTDFMECLADEPKALEFFNTLTPGHQRYFSKWIDEAKTEPTKTKRIAQAIDGLNKKFGFGEMIRDLKGRRGG
jgi:hypothetical protein